MNIAFLASYNGSSAQAITDACLSGDLIAAPSLLITNNAHAKALEWAENKGLKTACLNSTTHPDPSDLDQAIAQKLRDHKIGMVVLSGYMKLIGPRTMDAVDGKILNIHPALLPKYGGKGMYGHHVHQAVKDNGDSETGATIHLVSEEYDEGKIIAQKKVKVLPDDSVDMIEEKVKAIEPEFYIDTIRKILKGDISFS
ncbi:MAG TPA: phosphoribosylglycinamide formyltransferase [Alphaproteobacteria bacterium]|nr:phosphoribosylglycinamide formyltransferase [Alphaproteobacteria bacterium]